MEAEREIFWNLPIAPFILYPLGLIAVILLIYAIVQRVKLWRIGKPEKRTDNIGKRIWDFIVEFIIDGIFHRRFLRDFYPGFIHFCLFIGGLLLLFGTAMDVISHYIIPIMYGNVYLGVSFAADFGGVLMLIGAILAVIRRYIQKPKRLDTIADDAVVITLVFVVVISGFLMEAFRMLIAIPHGLTQPEFFSHPEWAMWSFGGNFVAGFLSKLEPGTLLFWYNIFYWFHAIVAFGSIYYVCLSFTKLSHIIVSPINAFFKTYRSKGALSYVNLEESQNFGVNKIEHFTWKQILDLDACTNCGRCQDRCPAYLSEKPLSPKKIIQDLKTHWLARGPELLKDKKASPKAGEESQALPVEAIEKPIIGEVILEDEIWSCTTCRACQDICPVFIEHIDKIVDMRRNLVLEQAKMPETGEAILKCIEARGHTCRGTTATRTEWTQGLDIKLIADNKDVDVLFWLGCAPSLEARNMKVAIATAKIFKAAGVNFAILGEEESCCGEPARRLGNEYLYQMQAMRNIELMKSYGVKKIVTICPHCYNTIKNEYPQFDGKFEVIHHSVFIDELMKSGKLPVTAKNNLKLTFHDSCYLGRHNDIYGQPRDVINNVNKSGIVEMQRSKDQGFCCGGGGGRFWMEERIGKRISEMRVEQIVETKAEVVASACPYCLQMFEDAIKAKEVQETLKAKDISEIVLDAIDKK